jgi:diamine N-acetyltransferase
MQEREQAMNTQAMSLAEPKIDNMRTRHSTRHSTHHSTPGKTSTGTSSTSGSSNTSDTSDTSGWSVATTSLKGQPLTLRAAVMEDAATLAAIGRQGFAAAHEVAMPHDALHSVLASTWDEQQMRELLATPEIQLLVAEIDMQVVGFACLNPSDRPTYLRHSAAVELCHVYLHPDWIGHGVGSKLIEQSLQRAAATGYEICWLRVWQGNKIAIDFSRRWGFAIISADTYAIGDATVPVWIMIHSL